MADTKKDTSKMLLWGIDEFDDYMRDNVKFGGNSKKFEAIRQGIWEFKLASQVEQEDLRSMAMAIANDGLLKACEVYLEERDGAFFETGKERLDVVRMLYKRQEEMGHETRLMPIAGFARSLKASKGIGDSDLYKDVYARINDIQELFEKPITEQTRREMQEAREALKQACGNYIDAREGARTGKGKERLSTIKALLEAQERELGGHLKNLEKPGSMEVYGQMTWGQADEKGASVLESRMEMNQSRREMEAQQEIIESMGSEKVSLESAMKMTKADKAYQKACETWMKHVKRAGTNEEKAEYDQVRDAYERQQDKNISQLRDVNILREYEGKSWNSIGRVRMAETVITGNREVVGDAASERIKVTVNGKTGFFTKSEAVVRPEDAFDQYVENLPVYMKSLLNKYRNVLRVKEAGDTRYESEPWLTMLGQSDLKLATGEAVKKHLIDNGITDSEILENDEAINHCVNMWKGVTKTNVAQTAVGYDGELRGKGSKTIDYGDEYAKRNVATTRVADYLGIGHLVARSEFMALKDGDRTVLGSFMEFAQGTDLNSKDPEDRKKMESVNDLFTPGFTKDSSNLAIFDYLCGQMDRHGYNMFYKLSEPDQEGHRAIVGLQGIDNDMSFLELEGKSLAKVGQLSLSEMVLLSEDLKESIMGMDGDSLEYLLGDLLKKEELETMKVRLDKMKDHIDKNMLAIEEDGWDLKKYDPNDPNLDADGVSYVKKVAQHQQGSSKHLQPWDSRGQYTHAIAAKFKEDGYENIKNRMAEYNKVLKSSTAENKPMKKEEVSNQKQKEKEAPSREKMNFLTLEEEERGPRKTKLAIGAHRAGKETLQKTSSEPVKEAGAQKK